MTWRSLSALLPLVCLGCVDMDTKLREPPLRPPTIAAPVEIAAPVSADQATPENARQTAQALWDELDREDMPPTAPATAEKRK
jgi:hypothetical protein